jgi:hypothetical protein
MFLAFGRGATHDAALHAERLAEISRATGRRDAVAVALGSAATFHAMADENDAALTLATEGLDLARELGAPSFISLNLTALAAALVDRDPLRSRALLHESIEHRARLGYENLSEIAQAVLISARIGDWPEALALAGPAVRHLQWGGSWPLLAAITNVAARALAADAPETAAVLQGAARQLLATMLTREDVSPANRESNERHDDSAGSPRTGEARDFITDLRRETAALLRDALGDGELRKLRSQGQDMQRDDAIAYTLNAISKAVDTI